MTFKRTPEDLEKRMRRQEAREQRGREALAAAADRRSAREEALQVERALPALRLIRRHHNFGVVTFKGSDGDYFLEGFTKAVERQKGGLLVLPAEGNIQGEDLGHEQAEDTLSMLSHHRREYGKLAVVAFIDFQFGDKKSIGTPLVARRVSDLLDAQNDPDQPNPGTGIVIIGSGDTSHLVTTGSNFMRETQHPVAGKLAIRYALDNHNELTTAPNDMSVRRDRLENTPIFVPPFPFEAPR
ncbi:hypothetical protein COY17_03625 [Candidatus Saccharibacteria bacterium CG_4_10_14_0_2_um_filter_52_9]|nr:MAG: hypothetical protein COY17_03625 [Candidatus Saccharibacteria bacterium CG_4_10_14_0_2_um_filter_52_9]